jgi:hypothetical protein
MRDSTHAVGFRYCRLRMPPGEADVDASWGAGNYLFEVDETGLPVRQIQIYDRVLFVYRFDREHPFSENAKGERFGGGLRTVPLTRKEIEDRAITHHEFEHAWLTGHLGERTIADYQDELMCQATYEGEQMLWEAWAEAEKWYPYQGAAGTLAIAERSIRHLVDCGYLELVDLRSSEHGTVEVVKFPRAQVDGLLLDRRSWLSPPPVWYRITAEGIADLRARGKIK